MGVIQIRKALTIREAGNAYLNVILHDINALNFTHVVFVFKALNKNP